MISLKDYVKRRNGVPLGHKNSLRNMLKRSLGANAFDVFWVHWNPIWNYCLNKYVYKPLKSICNNYLALVLTFAFSGFIHDLIGLLIYNRLSFLFTLWFVNMGIIVIIFKWKRLVYKTQKKKTNYGINLLLIILSLLIANWILSNFFNT